MTERPPDPRSAYGQPCAICYDPLKANEPTATVQIDGLAVKAHAWCAPAVSPVELARARR